MRRKIILSLLLIASINSHSQVLGGGTLFSNAVLFDQSWITGCPGAATALSNQVAYEPDINMDACAPAPACATGTTGSDVWYKFYAQASTVTIIVAPSSSFDVAIQAFSGSACPGLIDIGCIDAAGNNASETLTLTGLSTNTLYYFRIFGATTSVANRTGTYTFCGSTGLRSTILPVEFSSFNAITQNNNVILSWTTESESNNSYFEIERSSNGNQYQPIGSVAGSGTATHTTHYNFTDVTASLSLANYYRLKQVDIDGRFKYSTVLITKFENNLKKTVSISPNPVSDKINIRINSDVATNSDVRIFNSSGNIIYTHEEKLVKGANVFVINSLQHLANGVYTLNVLIDTEILSAKFICAK